MISILRTDSVEFKETKRAAISINPNDMTNETRKVVMVSLTIEKPANERAFGTIVVEGTVNDNERNEIRRWGECIVGGPCKVTMSV